MIEKAENIKRIMSSFLRMVGGRIKWALGVLHIRNEDDTAYGGLSAGNADLDSVSLQNSTRTEAVELKANPTSESYPLILPKEKPLVNATLQVTDLDGNTVWTTGITTNGQHVFEEIQMVAYERTYELAHAPNDSPIIAFVNGIEVDFNVVGNMIIITT